MALAAFCRGRLFSCKRSFAEKKPVGVCGADVAVFFSHCGAGALCSTPAPHLLPRCAVVSERARRTDKHRTNKRDEKAVRGWRCGGGVRLSVADVAA